MSEVLPAESFDAVLCHGALMYFDDPEPEAAELESLLACEERAGTTDPYRRVAALTHVIAVREEDGAGQ